MSRPPSPAERARAVADFNARHAVGDAFWAYKGLRGENPIACVLRTPAELLSGHTPVAWLDGVSGCIALTHLEPRLVEDALGQPTKRSIGGRSMTQAPTPGPLSGDLARTIAATEEVFRLTLCGSTKFRAEYELWNKRLTLAGFLVYSVSGFGHAGDTFTEEEKARLDQIHLAKIDASHAIVVLNVGGYVGESTAREIAHAKATGKPVYYLEGDNIIYRLRTGPDGPSSLRYRAFSWGSLAPTAPVEASGQDDHDLKLIIAHTIIEDLRVQHPGIEQIDNERGDIWLPGGSTPQSSGCIIDIHSVAQSVEQQVLAALRPGHTDLMVSPENIDAFLEANPPPVEASGLEREHGPKCWGKTSISDEMMYCYCGSTDSPSGETREALGGQKGDSETLRVLLDNLVIAQTLSKDIRQKATDEARSYLYDLRHTPQPSGETREAVRLALEDADALERVSEEADDNQWQDWAATMRQAASRIRRLALLSARPFALGGQQGSGEESQ